MLYCDKCAGDNNWPRTIGRFQATCEVCGSVDVCSDKPFRDLPGHIVENASDVQEGELNVAMYQIGEFNLMLVSNDEIKEGHIVIAVNSKDFANVIDVFNLEGVESDEEIRISSEDTGRSSES